MDDERNPSELPDTSAEALDQDRPTDRLVARLAELRSQLEVLAPQDQDKGREAIERIRQAQERIESLEEMLTRARELEHELTARTVRDRAQIFRFEAEISELSAIAARVSIAEDARRQAETIAAESERASALAAAEVEAGRAEIAQLRSRNAELEADLAAVMKELAAAAVARAEAVRLEAERDEARERARVERRLAAQDRRHAAEAGLRATELQHQLREAERRIVQVANDTHLQSTAVSEDADEQALVETPPPWIELQRASAESAPVETDATAGSDAAESASQQDEEPMVVEIGDAEPDVAEPDEVVAVEEPSEAAAPSAPSGSVAMPTAGSSSVQPPARSAEPAAKMPAPPTPWIDRPSAASTAAPWEAITTRGSESITSVTEEDDEPRVMEVEDASRDAERDVEVVPHGVEEPAAAEAPSAGRGSPTPTTSLWSASESAASIAAEPKPWRPAEPASWEPSHPIGSSDESSHEQTELIDLTATDQTSIDELDEDEADEDGGDEDGGADSGSTSGGGWAAQNEKLWQLLRGRRRD
jgi:hypothetical protein